MKRRNYNIFVGDKAYQMNICLDFKSKKSELKFQEDALTKFQPILNVFIILSSLLVIWSIISSLCFNFDQASRFSWASIISLFCLFLSLLLSRISNQRSVINVLLLVPSAFIYLIILDTTRYQTAVYMIVGYATLLSNFSVILNIMIRFA